MNLLQETIAKLKEENKYESDVLWCGKIKSGKWDFEDQNVGYFTWEEFEVLADKHYDSGFGSPEVNEYLIIVGKDWWLERHEYDGSEWWEYKTMPKKPENKSIIKVFN